MAATSGELIRVNWEDHDLVHQRERQLAGLFNGYHYVLSILAEIDSRFIPILRAHGEIIIEENSKPWNPPIYKVTLLSDPTHNLYLVGVSHDRIMREADCNVNDLSFTKEIISDQLQKILNESTGFGMEYLISSFSEEYNKEVKKIAEDVESRRWLGMVTGSLDCFQMLNVFKNVGQRPINDAGLDSSALHFWTQKTIQLFNQQNNQGPAGTYYNLEDEKTHLIGLKTLTMTDIYSDFGEIFTTIDHAIFGELEGIEQNISGYIRKNFKKYGNLFGFPWKARNVKMSTKIQEMLEENLNSVALVGFTHLFGAGVSINSFLDMRGKVSITCLNI